MDSSPSKEDAEASPDATHERQDEYAHTRKGKFRFKSSSSKSRLKYSRDSDHYHRHDRHHDRPHKRHHRHHDDHHGTPKRHKHNHRHRSASPQDNQTQNHERNHPLSPNAAFRESLFDALGDDEGAEYWESVYGQPIHTYTIPNIPRGPTGELEQMTDEEYAAYVRTRMWERTREGMVEMQEAARRERAREKRRERERGVEAEEGVRERVRFERAVEESLRRGEERRRGRVWRGVGEGYFKRWEEITTGTDRKGEGKKFEEMNIWPVQSGKRKDISREKVEEFICHALVPISTSSSKSRKKDSGSGAGNGAGNDSDSGLLSILKAERVRWHPDKIQHRYSALGIDEGVMRSVTEVFQIIDHMWNKVKEK